MRRHQVIINIGTHMCTCDSFRMKKIVNFEPEGFSVIDRVPRSSFSGGGGVDAKIRPLMVIPPVPMVFIVVS